MKRIQYYLKDGLETLSDLPDASIDLILIDPPYGTDPGEFLKKFAQKCVKDPAKRLGKTGKILTGILSKESNLPNILFTGETYGNYFKEYFNEAHKKLKPTGNLCIFQGLMYLGPTYNLIPENFYFRNIIIYGFWERRSVAETNLGTAYIPILWVSKSTEFYRNAKAIRKYFPNLPPEKSIPNIWISKRTQPIKYYSTKPLPVLMALIEFLCPPDGLVVDTFAGSGATGEAAILTGRKCIMSDIYEDALLTAKIRLLRYKPDLEKYYA